MSENQLQQAKTTSERALAAFISPFIGRGPMRLSNDQANFLYSGPADQAAAQCNNPQQRGDFIRLRAAADNTRALVIPHAQPTNLTGIYNARVSAPPAPEDTEQARAIGLITGRLVENERLHAERRRKRYSDMLEAFNPKCITTIDDRAGGHQCGNHSIGGKYCKRHLDVEVCARHPPPPARALVCCRLRHRSSRLDLACPYAALTAPSAPAHSVNGPSSSNRYARS
jgi:hypothetical protein